MNKTIYIASVATIVSAFLLIAYVGFQFLAPSRFWLDVKYIQASDVTDGHQYMEMCREIDRTRPATFIWELYTANGQTVFAHVAERNAEKNEDCTLQWSSVPDANYKNQLDTLPEGEYYWELTTTIEVFGQEKTDTATSNVFRVER